MRTWIERSSFAAPLVVVLAFPAAAEVLHCNPSDAQFARGYCSVVHTDTPNGWVRASASLDKETGELELRLELESDWIDQGPKGTASVTLLDKKGAVLATVAMPEQSRGGKSCGKADPCGRSPFVSTTNIPKTVAARVDRLTVAAKATGARQGFTLDLPALVRPPAKVSVPVRTPALNPQLAPIAEKTEIEAAPEEIDLTEVRIIGGVDVPIGAYPWTAAIYMPRGSRYVQACGGSLVDASWVLTAAHCQAAKNWVVVVGRTDLSDPSKGEVFKVSDVIPHEAYDAGSRTADLALLRLTKPSKLPLVTLATKGPDAGTPLTVVGWGARAVGGPPSALLQQVDVLATSADVCTSAYPGKISSTMMCAGFPDGEKDACHGDSGGPLFRGDDVDPAKFVQYGVVSWGEGCARAGRPGVYTNVSNLKAWVDTKIQGYAP